MPLRYPPARLEIMPGPNRILKNNNNQNAPGKMTFRRQLDQYLDQASLHGLSYIGDRTITWFERIFFFCMLLLVVALSGYFISNMWSQWTEQTIVTVIPKRLSARTVPFPAVTICNTNLVRRSAIEQMTPNSVEHSIAQDHCLLDEWHLPNSTYSWKEIHDVVNKVSHPCDELIVACRYGDMELNCSRLFRSVKTEKSICCMFNAIPSHKFYKRPNIDHANDMEEENPWHPEHGFQKVRHGNPYAFPNPFTDGGTVYGLRLILNGNVSERYCSDDSNAGFMLHLHNVYEQPYPTGFGHLIKNGHESRVIIVPYFLQTKANVKKVPKHVRRCLFQDESPLDFFGTHSRRNCLAEMLTKRLFSRCNCTFMTLPPIYDDANICSKVHTKCLEDFVDSEANTQTSINDVCLDACWESAYRSKMSSAQIKNRSIITEYFGVENKDMALLTIYFPMTTVRVYQKAMLNHFTEFLCMLLVLLFWFPPYLASLFTYSHGFSSLSLKLSQFFSLYQSASIGGLLGFFFGFSLISIAEIFYFICIRPHCISRQMMRPKIIPQPKRKPIISIPRMPRMPRIFDPYAEDDSNYIPTIYLE